VNFDLRLKIRLNRKSKIKNQKLRTMPSNQENIEAKLAAYVDGELSGADREEIERHLTANPQHRKLIIELTQTRTMLQGLPRAKAPMDVMDSLQSQLERSALLGSPEQLTGDDSYKIGFWTQFRAVAAILVLTCGLAAVVYYVLPRGEPKIEMAGGPNPERSTPVTVEESAKTLPPAMERSAPRAEVASKAGFTDALSKDGMPAASTPAAAGGSGPFKLEAKAGAASPITAELHQQLAANGVNDAGTYIVVDTSDSAQANATVSNYLNFNRVTWEQIPPLALARTGHSLDKIDLAKMLTSPAAVAEQLERQAADKQKAGTLDQVAGAKMAADDAAERDRRMASQGLNPADSSKMDLSPQAIQSQQILPPSQAVQLAAVYNTNNMIVARNLSQKQVAELNGLLNQQNVGIVSNYQGGQQTAQQWVGATNSPATAAPIAQLPSTLPAADAATQPVIQRIKVGDTLTLVIPDSGMGEVVVTAQVDPAGLLSGVNNLGGLMVGGLTLDELNQSIAARFRETNQIANNVASVVPRATKITEAAPDTTAAKEIMSAEKQQVAAPGGAVPGGVALVDERRDVVIIVRDIVPPPPMPSINAAPATPATQPQAAPPSTQP
jgi:hypothetical protein